MDPFRTHVDIPVSPDRIGYQTRGLFMGSCFAEDIGRKMESLKFPVLLNPFGTLFNPASIADNLEILLSGKTFPLSRLLA